MSDDADRMLAVAKRVNWYTPPKTVVANRPSFIAQIMARGVQEDILWMQQRFALEEQREAYAKAPPGIFSRRSWAYWGLMLLGDPKALPYPVRFPEIPESRKIHWRGH